MRLQVEAMFDRYGPIAKLDVKRARSGFETSFAFLEYQHPRDAEDAVRGEDRRSYRGNPLRVQIAQGGRVSSSSRGPPTRTEYRVRISGLPEGTSWQDIKDFVRVAGEPGYTNVYNEGGAVFGIVEFVREDDMRYALRKLDGAEFENRRKDKTVVRVDEERGYGPSSGGGGGGGRDRDRDRDGERGGRRYDDRDRRDRDYGRRDDRDRDRDYRGGSDRHRDDRDRGGRDYERSGRGDRDYDRARERDNERRSRSRSRSRGGSGRGERERARSEERHVDSSAAEAAPAVEAAAPVEAGGAEQAETY